MDDDGTRRKSTLKPKDKKLPNKSYEILGRARDKITAINAPLIAEKKKKYSNVDISSPMSNEEKELTKKINANFSRTNSITSARRKIDRGENRFVGGVRQTKKSK